MTYGSLFNSLMANSNSPAPEKGMGCTMLMWSDRHAATIIDVSKTGKSITVQRDKATRTDECGMSDAQSYSYEADPDGSTQVFTLRKNGRWVRKDDGMKSGTGLLIGARREYHDYSF